MKHAGEADDLARATGPSGRRASTRRPTRAGCRRCSRRCSSPGSRPFSSSSGFCCSSAFSGTANQPPAEANQQQRDRAPASTTASRPESARLNTPMPNAPIGTSPSSILSPDSRPATRLPSADADRERREQPRRRRFADAQLVQAERQRARSESARRRTRRTKCRPPSSTACGPGAAGACRATTSPADSARSAAPGFAAGVCGMP